MDEVSVFCSALCSSGGKFDFWHAKIIWHRIAEIDSPPPKKKTWSCSMKFQIMCNLHIIWK